MKLWKNIIKVLFTGFEYKGQSYNPVWLILWRLALWPCFILSGCLVSLIFLLALEPLSAKEFFNEHVKFW